MFVPSPNGVLDELAQKYGLSVRSHVSDTLNVLQIREITASLGERLPTS